MEDDEVATVLRDFVSERDWDQFHSPENLAKSIVIEAGELLECFQWQSAPDRETVLDKLATTRAKYPVEKARGSSKKYDQLPY